MTKRTSALVEVPVGLSLVRVYDNGGVQFVCTDASVLDPAMSLREACQQFFEPALARLRYLGGDDLQSAEVGVQTEGT